MKTTIIACLIVFGALSACKPPSIKEVNDQMEVAEIGRVQPVVITEESYSDTDDPCIWINYNNPEESLILGTDKDESNGGIYVYDLNGRINREKTIVGLKRPNNIDLVYHFNLNGLTIDIAVFTERKNKKIRVLRVPEMVFIDNGGIDVFEGSEHRSPMGIALFKNKSDNSVFAIVGRKKGPAEGYLHQYKLEANRYGVVEATLVRSFGAFSGKKEIESIAVDNDLGFVYYSDEGFGIRKYYANPEMGNEELAVFGSGDFALDSEGISIYPTEEGKGFIIISNQGDTSFNIYTREGSQSNPHQHELIKKVPVEAKDSDGSDITPFTFGNRFRGGLFVAMSSDKTFHFYHADDIIQYVPKN
jgi:3-phytase